MASPFSFATNMLWGPQAKPAADPYAGTTPAPDTWVNRIFGPPIALQQQQQLQAIEMEKNRLIAQITAEAARLAEANPGMDQGRIFTQLFTNSPVGAEVLVSGRLSSTDVKDIFEGAIKNMRPRPDVFTVQPGELQYGLTPGSVQPFPMAQGSSKKQIANPAGRVIGEQTIPGSVFQQPAQPAAPAVSPQAAPGAPQLPPGMSTTTPLDMGASAGPSVAPTGFNFGALPQSPVGTPYGHIIQLEGTAMRGDPFQEVYGYGKYGTPPKPLTEMTLGEVKAFGREMRRKQMVMEGTPWDQTSSAVGAFQIVGNTMEDVQQALGLPDSTRFTPEVQMAMADYLWQTRGGQPWEAGDPRRVTALESGTVMQGQPKNTVEILTSQVPDIVRPEDLGRFVTANKATMFLGAGAVPWAMDWLGRTGRQINPDWSLAGSEAVAMQKAALDQLKFAVHNLRSDKELKSVIDVIEGINPDTGVGTDPKTALLQGLSLEQLAATRVQQLTNDINLQEGTEAGQQNLIDERRKWRDVLAALPPREDMIALLKDIEENPLSVGGLTTPGSIVHGVLQMLTAMPGGGVGVGAGQTATTGVVREAEKALTTPAVPEKLSGVITPELLNEVTDAELDQWRAATAGNPDLRAKVAKEAQPIIIQRLQAYHANRTRQ